MADYIFQNSINNNLSPNRPSGVLRQIKKSFSNVPIVATLQKPDNPSSNSPYVMSLDCVVNGDHN